MFFLIVDRDGYIDKAVILSSETCQGPENNEINLLHLKIKATEIESEPAFLWGNRNSFDQDYVTRISTKRVKNVEDAFFNQ